MELLTPKLFALCFLFLVNAPLSFAQQTDFTGKWILKDQHSISGTLYHNGVPRKIEALQQKEKISVQKTSINSQNEDVIANEILFLNGQPSRVTTQSNRKKIIVLEMNQDKKGFTTTTTFYKSADSTKVSYRFVDIWRLDSTGNLTIDRESTNFENKEVWRSKALYEKQ